MDSHGRNCRWKHWSGSLRDDLKQIKNDLPSNGVYPPHILMKFLGKKCIVNSSDKEMAGGSIPQNQESLV